MMNDSLPPSPPSEPEKPGACSSALITWCLLIGILTLVLAPIATIKLASWKIRQDEARKAAIVSNNNQLSFGGPFTLTNHNGVKVTDATFRGKYLLVYFGYTFCPDLCSTALQNITETLVELGSDADKAQVLFITIDPDRDTPAKLKDYVASFDPKIMGLTGSPQQIESVTKAFHVTYSKAEKVDGRDYMMDHSTYVYVMDPAGKPLAKMDMEQVEPAAIADSLRQLWGLPKR